MTTPVYITSAGLEIPTVEDLLSDMAADMRALVDPGIDTEAESPQGNINGIFAERIRAAWEVIQIAYNGLDPDDAEGSLLEGDSALTGTLRAAATSSTLKGTRGVRVNLNAVTPLPAGTAFSVNGNPAVVFVTDADMTSVGAGDYLVDCHCSTLGPVSCNAGTLTIIATPVAGLNSVTNDFDAILGTNADTDPQLRSRREDELRATGSGTIDSLRSDLLAYKDNQGGKPILSCNMFENQTDIYSFITGLPPHSFEALVFDGLVPAVANDAIAQVIWSGKPGGIQPKGNTSGTAIDSLGTAHTIPFSRPSIVNAKAQITIQVKASEYAGDAATKQAIIDRFLLMFRPSVNLRFVDYISALVYDQGKGVAGVYNITNFQFGIVGGGFQATFTDLVIATREVPSLETVDITLTVVNI